MATPTINGIKRRVICECVRTILAEADMSFAQLKDLADGAIKKGVASDVGSKGPLSVEKGADIYDGGCHLVDLGELVRSGRVGKGWLDTIFRQYSDAMLKHNDSSSVTNRYMITDYLLSGNRKCFTNGRSVIMLSDTHESGYWLTTHFAPYDMRDGYGLMKELFSYSNIIMMVTEHMWGQLAKMGLCYPEFIFPVPFKGHISEKMMFTSDRSLLESQYIRMVLGSLMMKGGKDMRSVMSGVLDIDGFKERDMYGKVHPKTVGKHATDDDAEDEDWFNFDELDPDNPDVSAFAKFTNGLL